jgi:hypothetical protein
MPLVVLKQRIYLRASGIETTDITASSYLARDNCSLLVSKKTEQALLLSPRFRRKRNQAQIEQSQILPSGILSPLFGGIKSHQQPLGEFLFFSLLAGGISSQFGNLI